MPTPEERKSKPNFDIEQNLARQGCTIIAGIDEAGRGALAGPLSVGIVIYDISIFSGPMPPVFLKINDSKKLSPKKRLEALNIIECHAALCDVKFIPHKIIDDININGATEYAIQMLLKKSPIKPDIVLLDGSFSFDIGAPVIPVIGGDSKSLTIASASIKAKVNRDMIITRFSRIYPEYGFEKNMGYGTKQHRDAILKYGPTPIHRKTYEPVKSILSR